MGLYSESKFNVRNCPQAWQGTPLGRIVTSKHYHGCLQGFFRPSSSLSYQEYSSMLVHIRADVLLPLDIKSQSKNEKLIWISPVVSWRMLLGLYVKKHWERWFIWSLRNWLFNINLKWKPLARSVAMVWKLKFQ